MTRGIPASNIAFFAHAADFYKIPAELVKEGRNVLAVRAYSFMHDGALGGDKDKYFIQPDGESEKIFFAGTWWKAFPEYDLGVLCPAALPGPGFANTPGILFNSMVRPLIPYGIRGVIWYQGESNARSASDSLEYEDKLCTMICVDEWVLRNEEL